MNTVEALLQTPFCQLSLPQKLEVKRLGPHQPRSCPLKQVSGKTRRSFRLAWYETAKWLCYSESKDALFCFFCLLFSPNTFPTWTKTGFRDLKHLSERITAHKASECHLHCAIRYETFGTDSISSQIRESHSFEICSHNAAVDKNRLILNRAIDIIKILGKHELPFRGQNETRTSDNRGVCLSLLNYIATLDERLRSNLETSTVAENTSKTIENDLLDSMYQIYMHKLKSDISSCNFLSIEADDTTDISSSCQLVVILRYVSDDGPVERFHSFVQVRDRTVTEISTILQHILQHYDAKQKLIAQTYDGAAVMSGSRASVQTVIKKEYPHAHFVHCYAHQLHSVIKRICSANSTLVRLFFIDISGFSSFFAHATKRSDLFTEICNRQLPSGSQSNRLDFQSRVVRSVQRMKPKLIECFNEIITSPEWDELTVREAVGLHRLLSDVEFCFFLDFFAGVFDHVDLLYNSFRSRSLDGSTNALCVSQFCDAISCIRKNLSFDGDSSGLPDNKTEETVLSAARECCDVLVVQLIDRLDNEHVATFSLVQPCMFSTYKNRFPRELLTTATQYFPMISAYQLEHELKCLYSNSVFSVGGTPLDILRIIKKHSLSSTFPALSQFIRIVLATPVSSAEPDCPLNTLTRVKTFLRRQIGPEGLNALAVLSIHNDIINNIENFNNLVIDHFARKKIGRTEYYLHREQTM